MANEVTFMGAARRTLLLRGVQAVIPPLLYDVIHRSLPNRPFMPDNVLSNYPEQDVNHATG